MIFIFVDGVGFRDKRQDNPLFDSRLDYLHDLIHQSKKIDPLMGVEGIPQSATGQTSIFSGLNASKINGKHKEGFPNKKLKQLLKKQSIFKLLKNNNLKPTFANSYIIDDTDVIMKSRFVSVTTFMTINSLKRVRGLNKLINGEAVYQDITNSSLNIKHKTYQRYKDYFNKFDTKIDKNSIQSIKNISPIQASKNILNISEKNDFTLFEYFQTDKAGHKRDYKTAVDKLIIFQDFLRGIIENYDLKNNTLVVISDHGNIENLSIKTHTKNKVPLIALGKNKDLFENIRYLYDIYDIINENIKYFFNIQ